MNRDTDLCSVHLYMQDWRDIRNWLCIRADNLVLGQCNLASMSIRRCYQCHGTVNLVRTVMVCMALVHRQSDILNMFWWFREWPCVYECVRVWVEWLGEWMWCVANGNISLNGAGRRKTKENLCVSMQNSVNAIECNETVGQPNVSDVRAMRTHSMHSIA